jgi:hypothetical protein
MQNESKAILSTGRKGLKGSEILRIPNFLANRPTGGGEVLSFTHQLPLYSPQIFLLHSLVLISFIF